MINIAIEEAKKALRKNEVPVGAVIVKNGAVLAKAFNMRETKQNATSHAEILAINKACKKLKSWRLDDCQIYVTLLPCPMCAGAIVASRIKTVYVGAVSPELDLIKNIFKNNSQNHKVELVVLNNSECGEMLQNFFKKRR